MKQINILDQQYNNQIKSYFLKLSGNLPLKIPQMIQTKTNNQSNKQTIKNNFLSQIKSNLYETSRKSSCGYLKIFKNKQTTKQISIFYLSQIKSNLYEMFRKSSCRYSKMIQTKMQKNKFSILAKSSLISMKLSENLHGGILR